MRYDYLENFIELEEEEEEEEDNPY